VVGKELFGILAASLRRLFLGREGFALRMEWEWEWEKEVLRGGGEGKFVFLG